MLTGIYQQVAPVLFGANTLERVGEQAKDLRISRAIVVTDKGIASIGYPSRVVTLLEQAGIETVLWDCALPDCPATTIREAAAVARAHEADGIIGIGGGSSLDTAKALGVVVSNGDEVLDEIVSYLTGAKVFEVPALPVIAIPTTSGTGSEVTRMAVIDDPKNDTKIGLPCSAAMAIVDPTLTLGSPAGLTAGTGMDAFGHAVECLCAKGCTAHTEMLAYEAIEQIAKWLPKAVEDRNALEPREHMAFAANLAGIAFSEDNCHVGHVVAHILGHEFGIPHGIAVAAATPATIEFSAQDHPGKIRKLGNAMMIDVVDVDDEHIGKVVADGVRYLMKRIGIPSLADKGVDFGEFMSIRDEAVANELSSYYDGDVTPDRMEVMLVKVYNWQD